MRAKPESFEEYAAGLERFLKLNAHLLQGEGEVDNEQKPKWPDGFVNHRDHLALAFKRMGAASGSSQWIELAEFVKKVAPERLSDTRIWVDMVREIENPYEEIQALAIIQADSYELGGGLENME